MNSTKNYDMFEFITANRSINRSHVNKLKKSLSEYGFLSSQPITVSNDMKIIDGQHRFIACKEMGIPINYQVVDIKKNG